MNLLHTFRSARNWAQFVLAIFMLVVSLSAAAPWLHTQDLTLVCTGTGSMQWVSVDGDSVVPSAQLDCPLCMLTGTPPPVTCAQAALHLATCAPPDLAVATWVAPFAGAALPARGPPPAPLRA